MIDFLFALIELFAVYYGSRVMKLGCFHMGRPLCTHILPGQVVHINHS